MSVLASDRLSASPKVGTPSCIVVYPIARALRGYEGATYHQGLEKEDQGIHRAVRRMLASLTGVTAYFPSLNWSTKTALTEPPYGKTQSTFHLHPSARQGIMHKPHNSGHSC